MPASPWDPQQYERFAAERSQPFFDLLALVEPEPAMRVVDLGCGTGELTRRLHDRLSARETQGWDTSPTMLGRSPEFATESLTFFQRDVRDLDDTFDLVFSNAALQWVDDHESLFERLTAAIAPGGQLAVQMPANHDHVSHVVARDVAMEEPFRTALGGVARQSPVLAPGAYARLLYRFGYERQSVRLQVYAHVLPSPESVVEWVRGTLLTDYERRLPAALYAAFLDRYRAELFSRLGDERPTFYPFERLLIWARQPRAAA